MITCANCGTENEADSVFCSACNHFLQWDDPAPAKKPRRRRTSSDLAAALGAVRPEQEAQSEPALPEVSDPKVEAPAADPTTQPDPGDALRQAGGADRQAGGADRQAGGADRQAQGADRQAEGSNRPAQGTDRPARATGPESEGDGALRQAQGTDRQAEGTDRPAQGTDRPARGTGPEPLPEPEPQPEPVPQAVERRAPKPSTAKPATPQPPTAKPPTPQPPTAQRSTPKPSAATPSAATPVRPGDPGASVQEIIAAIDAGREIASSQGRTDLDQHLHETKERLAAEQVQVVFCGQFKVGKSTMINALLQSAVCPVDADVVTAVPTIVKYSAHPKVTTYVRTEDGAKMEERERPLGEIDLLVTEEADPSDPESDRVVEVGLPHRMLRTGLAMVDTPGVGGLDSAHGFLTLGALRYAKGVVFVTDAAQELTGPELSFLKTAVERCPTTAVVVTKIDLYPYWRRIVELDRKHLANAGLDLPIIPVSSFLRLRAAKDPDLNAESGFAELVTFLARDVVAKSRDKSAKTAAVEVDFVASQLEQQSQAERAVLEAPDATEQVVKELDRVQEQVKRLIHPTATWQQTLSDRIQDLTADVEHDLQARLRTVIHDVEEVIDSGDPKDTWDDTEVWLRRQIAIVTVANRDLLVERAAAVAQEVADHFKLPEGSKLALPLAGDTGVEAVVLAPASTLAMPGGKLAPLLMAARSSYYLPMMAGTVAANMMNGNWVIHLAMAGIAMVLGTGIGKKVIGDEKKRQITYRQQQAKSAVRRFVDEVAFVMNKETRDVLRTAQRHLRDDFQARAMQLERSAYEAMEAARRVSELDGPQLAARERELQAREDQLESVRATARGVAGTRELAGARG